jgi:hypothetical protein
MSRLGKSFAVASASLALFGFGRMMFNLAGLQVFGPATIGTANIAISMWSLVAVVIATVPSFVVSKYVSEFVAAAEPKRAAQILTMSLLTTSGALFVAVLASLLVHARSGSWPWPLYGGAFGTYLVCRAACFAHQRMRTAFQGEVFGFVAFAIMLLLGLAARSVTLAAAALIAQPTVYCARVIWGFRHEFRFQGAFAEIRDDLRR